MAQHPTFLNRARNNYLESTIRGLKQNTKKLEATTIYRSSNADRRVGNSFFGPNVNDFVRTNDYNDTGNDEGHTEMNENHVKMM